MLQIEQLEHSFGEQPVLENFSLTVNSGEIACLLEFRLWKNNGFEAGCRL